MPKKPKGNRTKKITHTELWISFAALIVAIFSFLLALEGLNATKIEISKNIELDSKIQNSLFQSLNTKLDYTFALASYFSDHNGEYLIGSKWWQNKFPEEFEQYIHLLRISDVETVTHLVALEEKTFHINEAIELSNDVLVSPAQDINRENAKKAIWEREWEGIKSIQYHVCQTKIFLTKKYFFPFKQPVQNNLLGISGPVYDSKHTCPEPY